MRALLASLLLVAAPAAAQTLEDRLRDQLRATVTELRAAQASLAAAESGKAAAEKERDALKAKAAAPADSAALGRARADAAAALADAERAQASLAAAQAQAETLRRQLAESRQQLAQVRAEAAANAQLGGQMAASLRLCAADNDALVATGKEVLAAYEQRFRNGQFPPLQLARTRFENAAQVYGDRIAAARFAMPEAFAAPNAVNGAGPRETETKPK